MSSLGLRVFMFQVFTQHKKLSCVYTCANIYFYLYIFKYKKLEYIHTYIYICVYKCVCIYIYVYIYICKYIHTHFAVDYAAYIYM